MSIKIKTSTGYKYIPNAEFDKLPKAKQEQLTTGKIVGKMALIKNFILREWK